MTDLYLPQLGIQIETDEAHHLGQVELDQIWEKDIINATKHVFKHVKVNCGIDEVNRQIDEIVTFIKLKIAEKNASGDFKSWDLEAEQNPETYIKKGYIDASEDVAFRTIRVLQVVLDVNTTVFKQLGSHIPVKQENVYVFPSFIPTKIGKTAYHPMMKRLRSCASSPTKLANILIIC